MDHARLPASVAGLIGQLDQDFDERGAVSMDYLRKLHGLVNEVSAPLHARAAYYRFVKWGIAMAHEVLPVWEAASPDRDARSLLERSIACLASQGSMEELANDNEQFFTRMMDIDDPGLQLASAGSLAVSGAVRWVVHDLDPQTLDIPIADLDPAEWHPAIYAAIAASGGTSWSGSGSIERRKAFWRWSIQNALPAVWDPLTRPGRIASN